MHRPPPHRHNADSHSLNFSVLRIGLFTNLLALAGVVAMMILQMLFEQWRGDLFVGGLISQDIRRIDPNEGGQIVGQSALLIGQRVRDVRQARGRTGCCMFSLTNPMAVSSASNRLVM